MIETLKRGDVIAEKFPHDMYGCMIVLEGYDSEDKTVKIVLSTYMKNYPPEITDSDIMNLAEKASETRKINRRKEIIVGNSFLIGMNTEKSIIGNIPVESIFADFPISSVLSSHRVYIEWLKNNYPEEVPEFWESLEKGSVKYKYMSEKTFWSVIDQMFPDKYTDEYALKVLSDLSEDKIIRFNNRLAVMLDSLNDLEKIDENGEDYISEDLFLYQRCFVVVQGKDYYKQLLKSGRIDITNLNDEYEELLNLPMDALESKGIEVEYEKLMELV